MLKMTIFFSVDEKLKNDEIEKIAHITHGNPFFYEY